MSIPATKASALLFMLFSVLTVGLVVNAVDIVAASLVVGIFLALILDYWGPR